MKPKRRQELQTNDLAQMIMDAREWLSRYGNYVIGAVVAVIIVGALFFYIRQADAAAREDALQRMRSVRFFTQEQTPASPEDIRTGIETLREVADETKDKGIVRRALLTLASQTFALSTVDPRNVNTEYLDVAEQACRSALDRFADEPVVAGRALLTLAAIEGNRFVAEQGQAQPDGSHKQKAREYLERITGDTEKFGGTPFMSIALNAISNLNETFQVVSLAAPSPPPVPSTQPAPSPFTTQPVTQPAPTPAPTPAVEEIAVPPPTGELEPADTNAEPQMDTVTKPPPPALPSDAGTSGD
jgi:hypothetical protein